MKPAASFVLPPVVVCGEATSALIPGERALDHAADGGVGHETNDGGVTPNDAGDGDIGPNNLQNFPVLASASSTAASTFITGTLNSTPDNTFELEFFSNMECDPSGHGEGESFLGWTTVMTDANGNAGFAVNLPEAVPVGRFITSIATDPGGNTSEFSQCITIVSGVVQVEIDIRPWSDTNPINPMSQGVIPVALLGSDTFDVADVDVTTLAFGPADAPVAHQNGPHSEDETDEPYDFNNDGLDDLLAHFLTEESGIAFGDTEACVTGELLNGTPFEGCEEIVTVPVCGLGFELVFLLPPLTWLHQRRRRRT